MKYTNINNHNVADISMLIVFLQKAIDSKSHKQASITTKDEPNIKIAP